MMARRRMRRQMHRRNRNPRRRRWYRKYPATKTTPAKEGSKTTLLMPWRRKRKAMNKQNLPTEAVAKDKPPATQRPVKAPARRPKVTEKKGTPKVTGRVQKKVSMEREKQTTTRALIIRKMMMVKGSPRAPIPRNRAIKRTKLVTRATMQIMTKTKKRRKRKAHRYPTRRRWNRQRCLMTRRAMKRRSGMKKTMPVTFPAQT
mmetsp:Transcript_1796/g.5243  ORF Transcript_1796/g.5243 Transcript_1796/m.5243 type:complete len:202 (-) Transcript_1796:1696-2301(-)